MPNVPFEPQGLKTVADTAASAVDVRLQEKLAGLDEELLEAVIVARRAMDEAVHELTRSIADKGVNKTGLTRARNKLLRSMKAAKFARSRILELSK